MSLFKDLPHAALPLTGFERIPAFQVFQPDDVYIQPIDIANMPVVARVDATTAITPPLTDAFKIVETTATSNVVYTVPPHATVPHVAGTVLQVQQLGIGRVTYVAGPGVTIRWPKAADGVTDCRLSRCINAPVSFRQRATLDDWVAEGDLSAT